MIERVIDKLSFNKNFLSKNQENSWNYFYSYILLVDAFKQGCSLKYSKDNK